MIYKIEVLKHSNGEVIYVEVQSNGYSIIYGPKYATIPLEELIKDFDKSVNENVKETKNGRKSFS